MSIRLSLRTSRSRMITFASGSSFFIVDSTISTRAISPSVRSPAMMFNSGSVTNCWSLSLGSLSIGHA